MKVLFINTVCGTGSTGRICTDLAKSYEAQGHEVKITYRATQKLGKDFEKYGVCIGTKWDVYAHVLLSRITDKAGFYSKAATRKLVQYIRTYQPDVIHLHNLHGYYINLEVLFDYLKHEYKGKVLWTLHDCWAFTGHCVYYSYAGCNKWKTGCHNCVQRGQYPISMVVDRSRKNYEDKKRILTGVPNMTIATVSQWLKEQVEDSFLNCYPVVRVYNGIDYTVFRPLESNIREELGVADKKMILAVADDWNEPRKGLSRLLELAKIAPEDWVFVIVGISEELIKKLPANNCIGLQRTSDREELVRLYTAADIFYNPSVEETFGLVTAEAIACGTYAVVMDVTACSEPMGIYGKALKTTDVRAALEAITEVLGWEKDMPPKEFTNEKMEQGYWELYTGKFETNGKLVKDVQI